MSAGNRDGHRPPLQIDMNDMLNKATVLVLNRNWQAINVRTPQDAFCQMATGVATALEVELGDGGRAQALRPVKWDEWITLPVRSQDSAVQTVRGPIRVPTVIVAVNYARVPKKRPKLCARTIRERDGNRCQYTGVMLRPEEGNIDHVVPRSRGGRDAWENCVWSSKAVNSKKGNRLPHEAGLKLLKQPVAVREMPVTALIRNSHGIPDWEPFVK
jgi:5-methylcytosine-specific restriction endonuclease McrA